MKLSERLLDEAEGYGPGPTTLQADDVRQLATLLREAAALAKRYEDAPVGFVMGQGLLTESRAAIVSMEDPAPVKGQRVRIVLDKEG